MRDVCENSVLLVDDDPSMRDLLCMRLEEAGFKARQAEDGIDGLVKLRDELPKVIISDLQMPRMSGIEFISVVRRRFPFHTGNRPLGINPQRTSGGSQARRLVRKGWATRSPNSCRPSTTWFKKRPIVLTSRKW